MQMHRCIASILGTKIMDKDEKYIGNPLSIGKRGILNFEALTNKVKSRLSSWKIALLSE